MKNRVPIIAAVILAIVGAIGLRSYVKKVEAQAEEKLRGRPVVAARADIAEGTELTEDLLGWKEIPRQFIPSQAIDSRDDMRLIVGRKAAVRIRAGAPVLWSDLQMERLGGLSSLIPSGERAFTVEIAAGVQSELLQLNDRVDILGIFEVPNEDRRSPTDPETSTVCVVLLQNVTVIAIGETIGQVAMRPSQFGPGGAITFAVTLPEAQMLMFSEQHGELALALRREGEIEILAREDLDRVTFQELERITSELDARRESRIVQIMKGREVEEVRIEER